MKNNNSSVAVEDLLRNAELRTELEPYRDEAVTRVQCYQWSVREENQYLDSMLRWEKAPVLPIYQWFNPPLECPNPQNITDEELPELLSSLVQKLYQKHIILDFTDHLSDRELYRLIITKILPSSEKKIESTDVYHHWDCAATDEDSNDGWQTLQTWLAYYASDEERELWAENHSEPLPAKQKTLYKRSFPKDETFHYYP